MTVLENSHPGGSQRPNRCEACGTPEDRATSRGLEVHERWRFDDTISVQAWRRLVAWTELA